jgi:hypothetical protein
MFDTAPHNITFADAAADPSRKANAFAQESPHDGGRGLDLSKRVEY